MAAASPGTAADAADLTERLAVYANPAGQAWPELRRLLMTLYEDRVSKLPFVPASWLAGVREVNDRPSAVVLAPPRLPNGDVRPGLPAWLAGFPDRVDVWAKVADDARLIVFHFAEGKVTEGRQVMQDAYDDAAFWDKAYTLAVSIRDLPANALGAVADAAGSVAGGVAGRLLKSPIVWVALAGGLGFLAWRLGFVSLTRKESSV